MRELIFQTDDEALYDGSSPMLSRKWLNARVYQTESNTYEVVMEYWDAQFGSSEEVLFSDYDNRDGAIIAAKVALKETTSNVH